jgi:undecaprenyl diphosphate synthase
VNRWTAACVGGNGVGSEPLTEGALRGLLDCPAIPDADLVIRTGGEQRVSNFLLWQSAYAELVFSDRLWPEFGADDLLDAVATYQLRVRKYGAVPDEAGNSK